MTHINDVWELDLGDLWLLAKQNDNFQYLQNVTDALTKCAQSVPLQCKTGVAVMQLLDRYLHE
jgi:hypothetical protein